jgi:hypothetical protein
LDRYCKADNRFEKSLVVHSIVERVRKEGGRFLKKSFANNAWTELNDQQAKEKVGHAIRDAVNALEHRAKKKTGHEGMMSAQEQASADLNFHQAVVSLAAQPAYHSAVASAFGSQAVLAVAASQQAHVYPTGFPVEPNVAPFQPHPVPSQHLQQPGQQQQQPPVQQQQLPLLKRSALSDLQQRLSQSSIMYQQQQQIHRRSLPESSTHSYDFSEPLDFSERSEDFPYAAITGETTSGALPATKQQQQHQFPNHDNHSSLSAVDLVPSLSQTASSFHNSEPQLTFSSDRLGSLLVQQQQQQQQASPQQEPLLDDPSVSELQDQQPVVDDGHDHFLGIIDNVLGPLGTEEDPMESFFRERNQ